MAKEKIKTPEATVAEIEKGLVPLQKEAKKIVIKTAEDVRGAATFLSKVKAYVNRINELQSFFTDPYVEQRRVALTNKQTIEAMFSPKLEPLIEIERTVKRAVSDYTLEEERKIRVEEARLQKIRDNANAKREEEGKGQILEPVKTIERATPTVKTEEGKMTTSRTWTHEVLDLAVLRKDEKFMTTLLALAVQKDLHNQVLRGMVRDGVREVGGVRIYEDVKVGVIVAK